MIPTLPGEFMTRDFFGALSHMADPTVSVNVWPLAMQEVRRLEMTVDDHGGSDRQPDDELDHPLVDSRETAALREQATEVLARYHQIELAEAAMLLFVLAEYRDCSVDALAVEVLRKAAARRATPDEPAS
ncbi:hypothetical protein [Kribbella steppae]|nr:hypothetical protein [Kribbella steppae]